MCESIQRLLVLRQFPGFADAELGELAVVGENVVETHLAPGTVVGAAGRVPVLHLVIDGEIAADGHTWGPRDVFGALEGMAGRPLAFAGVTTQPTRTLQMTAADFAGVLEDNFGLLSSVRRTLARRVLATSAHAPSKRRLPYRVRAGSLGLVDRLILLRHQITLSTGRIQPLAALAQATRERHFEPGDVLVRAGDDATSTLVIIDGSVRTPSHVLGPNDALGVVESLAETTYAVTAEAVTPVRALECPAMALFDVTEDHADLGLALISRLANELLDDPRLN